MFRSQINSSNVSLKVLWKFWSFLSEFFFFLSFFSSFFFFLEGGRGGDFVCRTYSSECFYILICLLLLTYYSPFLKIERSLTLYRATYACIFANPASKLVRRVTCERATLSLYFLQRSIVLHKKSSKQCKLLKQIQSLFP